MIAPILRLVLIYLALIAAVVAVFNRERLAGLFPGGDSAPAPVAAVAPARSQPAPAGAVTSAPPQPAPPAVAVAPAPAPGAATLTPPVATAPAPSAAAPDEAAKAMAIANAVNAARAAFWAGDVEGARAQMLALSRAHPTNPEVLGELGNLHFTLRDFPAAAEAWHRAGILLIEQGQGPQGRGFFPALSMIDPDKAADLAARAQGR